MDGIRKSDAMIITQEHSRQEEYNKNEDKAVSPLKTTSPITHRACSALVPANSRITVESLKRPISDTQLPPLKKAKNDSSTNSENTALCKFVGDVARTSPVQATMAPPDIPTVYVSKDFYHPMDEQPLIYGITHLMTHKGFREILSRYMDVYAVITDEMGEGNGAICIKVFGKPKFIVNKLNGNFFTPAFSSMGREDKSPFSSDLICFSLHPISSMTHDYYVKLKRKLEKDEKTNSIERSIFEKLKPFMLRFHYDRFALIDKSFLMDISTEEAKFMFEECIDVSIKQIEGIQGDTHHDNVLEPDATIHDLVGLLGIFDDRPEFSWKLNCLDEKLLNNLIWEKLPLLETPGVSPNAALLSMTQQRIPANWLIHLFTI